MKRLPKQERSKAKVAAILTAAAEQLRAGGYDGLSTAEVAKQAGVSVGTLYQFFDNKDDLMQAIAEQHVTAMQTFRGELFGADAVYVPPPIFVGRIVDWMVDYNTERPTFQQIFSGAWSDPTLITTLAQIRGGITTDLARILRHHAPTLPEARLQMGATVLVQVVKGMLGTLGETDPSTHPLIIAETKKIMLLYFENLAAIEGEDTE